MPVMKGKSMRSYTLHELTTDPEGLRRAEAFVASGLRAGAFEPAVDRVFPFEEIADAHRYLEGGSQIGKIVVKVDH